MRLTTDTRGLSTLEYALIFVMIVVAALLVWRKLGDSLETQLDTGTTRFDDTLALARRQDGSSTSTQPGAAQPSHGIAAPSNIPPSSGSAKPGTGSHAPAHGTAAAPSGATPGPASSQLATPSSNIASGAQQVSAPGNSGAGAGGDQPEPSWWERTREAVASSSAVQMGLGIAYGTVQALAPGGFIAPSPAPSSKPFEYGRGAGETATGIVQIVTGVGMLGGGGTTAAAGAVGAPATGGGSLVVSAGGLAVAAEGVAVIGQGLSNVGAGIITLGNAMSMQGSGDGSHGSGGGGNNNGGDRTRPSGKPDPDAKPSGKRTDTSGQDPDTTRSLQRENDSADVLAKGGYKVEQNPSVPGTRNPDYRIEGKVFDNYAPKTTNPRNIWSEIDANKVNPVGKPRQADRIVLNLSDSKVDMAALKKQFTDYPMKDLKEVLVIKDGQIIPFWP